MKSKIATQPSLLHSAPAHQQALKDEEHFRRWERNVVDKYKDKSEEEIRQDLLASSHPFAVMFENWIGDFNLATGIRNANAFNAKQIFYLGNRKWDKRGALGVYNYSPVRWLSTLDEVVQLQQHYTFIGVDNVPGSIPMETFIYPINPIFCFGEEGTGLTPALQSMCKEIIHISMYGSVRSFNCGTASGIVMYDYVKNFRKSLRPF